MSGRRGYIVGAVALVAAVVLALVGLAVLGVADDAQADNDRVVGAAPDPEAARRERPVGVRIGEAILGVADDRSYRDAIEIAKASTIPELAAGIAAERRAEAIAILVSVVNGDDDRVLRARAANLLGVIYFEAAKTTPENPRRLVEQSLGAFQDAVTLDPTSETAKANLELLATLPAGTKFAREESSGPEASASPGVGGGY